VKGKEKIHQCDKHKKRWNFPDCRFNNSTIINNVIEWYILGH